LRVVVRARVVWSGVFGGVRAGVLWLGVLFGACCVVRCVLGGVCVVRQLCPRVLCDVVCVYVGYCAIHVAVCCMVFAWRVVLCCGACRYRVAGVARVFCDVVWCA